VIDYGAGGSFLGLANEVRAAQLQGASSVAPSEHFSAGAVPSPWLYEANTPGGAPNAGSYLTIGDSAVGLWADISGDTLTLSRPFVPGAKAFRIEARIQLMGNIAAGGVGLFVSDATGNCDGAGVLLGTDSGHGSDWLPEDVAAGHVNTPMATPAGTNWTNVDQSQAWTYLRIDRDAGSNYQFFVSLDRENWRALIYDTGTNLPTSVHKAFVVGRVGILCDDSGPVSCDFVDFVA
jgi:hypothetical protein